MPYYYEISDNKYTTLVYLGRTNWGESPQEERPRGNTIEESSSGGKKTTRKGKGNERSREVSK